MKGKQFKILGITSLILSVYFYIWSVMDLFAGFEADTQSFIFIILFGFGIAFLICGGVSDE